MSPKWNRRDILKGLAAIPGTVLIRPRIATSGNVIADGAQLELQITPVSDHTLRLTLRSTIPGSEQSIPDNGSLVRNSWDMPSTTISGGAARELSVGKLRLRVSWNPVSITVANPGGEGIQRFEWDENSGALSFLTGARPLLGLGEGGPQYDRRGSTDEMRSGQGGYKLATHGGRVPIPWLIGTEGWAIFFHQPFGTFDFTGQQSKLIPKHRDSALPLDLFLIATTDPSPIVAEYARTTC